MSDFDCVICGGTVVMEGCVASVDIGIKDGRIAALQPGLGSAAKVIDAKDRVVLPGGIDSHTHIEQPGHGKSVNADTFETGTASAAVGGTTTVICFARQSKGGSLSAAVASYHEAARRSRVDYAFHLMITDPTPEVIEHELPPLIAAGNRSLKIFLANAGPRVTDAEALRVLAAARRFKAMVCIHAEHHDLI